ncbi:MAG: peptidoglycan DD-metalloendopeptidase family protein [Ilumatobacter sp.]
MGDSGARAHRQDADARPQGGSRPRRGIVWALVVSLGVAGFSTVASAQSETPAEQAAREIQEARDRANAAADAFFRAESDIDQLEDELDDLEAEEAALQATVDELRGEVEVVALARYIDSGTQGIPLLTDVSAPQDQVQADVYLDVLTNTGADVLDEYEFAQTELADTQDEMADRQEELQAQRETFRQLEQDALDEVERLREIEADRLEDEAVQRALEAKIAADLAEEEERRRLAAEAAARAQPNPGLVVPEPTATPDEVAAAPAPSGADDDTVPGTTTTTTTTIATNTGGSGGSSGGRTGGGGGGNTPSPVSNGGVYIDNILCPMPGAAYGDTWGAARSGGRRHEGVDLIAPRGLPIYAVVSGTATFKQNRLGGNAVSLVGDNGNRYYYAHLDRYEGSSRRVSAGELIGYNGDTGNARFSTPHLHFQVHPGGGQAVNPYPTVRAAGC